VLLQKVPAVQALEQLTVPPQPLSSALPHWPG
jgi:hypothetical protein